MIIWWTRMPSYSWKSPKREKYWCATQGNWYFWNVCYFYTSAHLVAANIFCSLRSLKSNMKIVKIMSKNKWDSVNDTIYICYEYIKQVLTFDSKNAPWDHFFSKLKWHYLYVTSTQNKCWPKMPHGTTTFHEYTKLNMTIVSGMSKNDWQPIDALSNSVYMLRIHKTSVDLCLQNCPMGPLLF